MKKNNTVVEYWPFIDTPDKKHIRSDILKNPEKFLKEHYTKFSFGADNLSRGLYREMGYTYNLRPFLKRYVYNQYGNWHECYALNKTHLRKVVMGVINEILEA